MINLISINSRAKHSLQPFTLSLAPRSMLRIIMTLKFIQAEIALKGASHLHLHFALLIGRPLHLTQNNSKRQQKNQRREDGFKHLEWLFNFFEELKRVKGLTKAKTSLSKCAFIFAFPHKRCSVLFDTIAKGYT